ncbi:MAG: hypothetical protein JWP59_292 [Massilia sp.]|jgi:hypothetical protein|nr:hypothetical protein [Massilia sp.]
MNLLLSDRSLSEVFEFARRYHGMLKDGDAFKLIVVLSCCSVVFVQQEQYVKLISCHIEFAPDVGFFFEEVAAAIGGNKVLEYKAVPPVSGDDAILQRNDNYVLNVIEFLSNNMNLLNIFPPPWFEAAMKLSDSATRRLFPQIADEDLQKKRQLLEYWNRSHASKSNNNIE